MSISFDENSVLVMARYLLSGKALQEICAHGGVVIKGAPLSVLAYGTPYKRISADIDILVSRQNISVVDDILKKNGYEVVNVKGNSEDRFNKILCLSQSHQMPPYYKCIDGIDLFIDINFDVFWGEYAGRRIDIDAFMADSIDMDIYRTKIKTLSPLKAMIQLILHHYKDMNSIFLLATRKSINCDLFKDIFYLLKNNIEVISVDKLYDMSKKYNILPYVFYILYYTHLLFNDPILEQYSEAFRTTSGEALLNCYGLCDKERKEWNCDFKTRIDSDDLFDLIKSDLTEKDKEKIAINKRVFLGINE